MSLIEQIADYRSYHDLGNEHSDAEIAHYILSANGVEHEYVDNQLTINQFRIL